VRLLLDTHLLLWSAFSAARLPLDAIPLLENPENELNFSAASLWEVAIKSSLGRTDFKVDARLLRRGLLDNGYREIAISSEHAVAIAALPPIHKDPFDRILVAQSLVENVTLVTSDVMVSRYAGSIQYFQGKLVV
jgi:PIN domain nuclease of toxin-antitoxin system